MISKTNSVQNQYEQVINYKMIYDGSLGESGAEGANTCSDFTGGWLINPSIKSGLAEAPITFTSNSIYVDCVSETVTMGTISTKNKLDLNDYVWGCIQLMFTSNGLSSYSWHGAGFDDEYTWNNEIALTITTRGSASTGVKKLAVSDITSINTSDYYFYSYTSDEGTSTKIETNFYEIFIVKRDDYSTLCTLAGLDASAYASENAICSDSEAIGTILNSKKAVDFMIYNCTGTFLVRFIQNSVSLSALEASPYKTLIYNNEHWVKFLGFVS